MTSPHLYSLPRPFWHKAWKITYLLKLAFCKPLVLLNIQKIISRLISISAFTVFYSPTEISQYYLQASNLSNGMTIPTLWGLSLNVTISGSNVSFNGGSNSATVVTPNIRAGKASLIIQSPIIFLQSGASILCPLQIQQILYLKRILELLVSIPGSLKNTWLVAALPAIDNAPRNFENNMTTGTQSSWFYILWMSAVWWLRPLLSITLSWRQLSKASCPFFACIKLVSVRVLALTDLFL